VLSSGRLVEQGAPQQLAAQKGGTFASMVSAAQMASAGQLSS
jgi:ABC-type multidrug transport system fused ATPase/permease subunit